VPDRCVRWATPVPQTAIGIYIVALTDDPDSVAGALADAPIAAERLTHLLKVRSELRLDGARPTATELARRRSAFWFPDEVVLYIGLAGQPLRTRVRQYYATPLGAKRPHAGGWWLKTLAVLGELWVHDAATPDYETAERSMLNAFAEAVSPTSRAALQDSERVAPFANLRTGGGGVKDHGITGATGDLGSGAAARPSPVPSGPRTPGVASAPPAGPSHPARRPALGGHGCESSQRVTARDLAAGQVRFPRASERLFPTERGHVDVVLRGHGLRARWDPRVGPDKERSGLLAFGRSKLDGLVDVDEVLTVHVRSDGRVVLE